MLVATGTSNMIKVEAVKIAFKHFYRDVRVMNVNTDNLPLQPITLNGTVNGAIKRASTAIQKINDADFGVGIEAGLMEIPDIKTYLNVQFAVIIDRDEKITIGSSSGFQLPNEVSKIVLIERMEVDKAVEFLYGISDIGEKRGIIDLMTKGAISRKELITNALIMAIAPRISEKH
ncbi:MAG: inosine/xanthosine triphosphatase [Thaumarchaeota archaeon]|nr:inosine/xanthosine triphosphatase [Nitrososphaerota archaeon]|tara:strand:- start:8197 stop:8721 length:525 start_codon:yes stop_codon:yes gene_type:complete